jgi:hypothetical protein
MPKRVSTIPQASNTDDTTIKFQYSFMSVPKFHDLSNNGTGTVLASSAHALETCHPPPQLTRPMHDPQYGTEKQATLILGVSYFSHLVYKVRFLSQEFLLVLHYLFTWPIFSHLCEFYYWKGTKQFHTQVWL